MKKKEEQLVRKVTDMIQKTREGKLHWDIQCQTTEYNDPAKKPVETEEGETWVIDECFVSYHCIDQEKEFHCRKRTYGDTFAEYAFASGPYFRQCVYAQRIWSQC